MTRYKLWGQRISAELVLSILGKHQYRCVPVVIKQRYRFMFFRWLPGTCIAQQVTNCGGYQHFQCTVDTSAYSFYHTYRYIRTVDITKHHIDYRMKSHRI
jgi:hypothetical protein